ncbi:hypothetical protein Trco_004120 [Trichoderma cornu-damae]|uniref:Uncharacterized protein n=1 Tax=Trichoderma cornu-damae TaxID=654480 RepID=A0A9P8TX76_9HYPO|nr:hypothetical protein Trco_004120 [Trichoderma cornu-damae]
MPKEAWFGGGDVGPGFLPGAGVGLPDGGLAGAACPGSTDMRSMRPRSRSRSSSACWLLLDDRSCSIWLRSWAPSDLRLLTNVSTFFSRLSTVSLISEYQFLALCRPASRSKNS